MILYICKKVGKYMIIFKKVVFTLPFLVFRKQKGDDVSGEIRNERGGTIFFPVVQNHSCASPTRTWPFFIILFQSVLTLIYLRMWW